MTWCLESTMPPFFLFYLTEEYARVKYMGICQLPGKPHRHLDIRIFNPAHFPCAILYATRDATNSI